MQVDMSVFEPPPKRPDTKKPLNLRVTSEFLAKLHDVMKLWKAIAAAKGDDPEKFTLTYVAVRCMSVGIDGAFAEISGGRPETEAQWKATLASIAKGHRRTEQ